MGHGPIITNFSCLCPKYLYFKTIASNLQPVLYAQRLHGLLDVYISSDSKSNGIPKGIKMHYNFYTYENKFRKDFLHFDRHMHK